jgi:hypothetical protein
MSFHKRPHTGHASDKTSSEHHAELIARVGYRVGEWSAATGMSKATTYRRINDGTLATRDYGGVTLILGFADEPAAPAE